MSLNVVHAAHAREATRVHRGIAGGRGIIEPPEKPISIELATIASVAHIGSGGGGGAHAGAATSPHPCALVAGGGSGGGADDIGRFAGWGSGAQPCACCPHAACGGG